MYKSEKPSDTSAVETMKRTYLEGLISPMHDQWLYGYVGASTVYELFHGEQSMGYCYLQEQTLMQLYLEKPYMSHGADVMDYLVEHHGVNGALAATIEPHYLSLCLDRQKQTKVHSYLFEDHEPRTPTPPDLEDLTHRAAVMESDFQTIVDHYTRTSEGGELQLEHLKGYIQNVIAHQKVFMFFSGDCLIGTGEYRPSQSQPAYADLGMIVAPEYRRKGVGSYILASCRDYGYAQQTNPICCCEADNLASRGAIEKAGFLARHRVLKLSF